MIAPMASGAETVLVVDDDRDACEALAELMREEGYRVHTAYSGAEALAALHVEIPDLVLADVCMPGGDGFQLIDRMRTDAETSDIPVMFMSALSAASHRIRGLEIGADDYIAKPIDLDELMARVRAHLRRQRKLRRLQTDRVTDELTGVLNRRGLFEALERERSRLRRTGGPLSVAVLDVDRFKAINDRFGHAGGDEALRAVARALSASVRPFDYVGRIGGDEFALVLPATDEAAAEALASRLEALCPVRVERPDGAIEVSWSIGAATSSDAEEPAGHLLERADEAMYRRKRQ